MCGLCGAFGAPDHWSDGVARPGPAQAGRRARAEAANRVLGLYGLRLAAWADRYTLSGRTGRTALVDHLGTLWPAAERLAGRPCDPLDLAIIVALEAR
ncbi:MULTISPECIES: hypothetical protein [Methylobacterium]|jgi:hypothetical protein|uniref:hypothetical protein n=1 Tax=Methylobacterium TaxID=407 RepID=UPI0008DEB7BC|nr:MULTISPECIES: hypothetical protein [Methylobacterium]MBZ6414194.1 hypothetical protein [Methylobacterium sp.]MBK3397213.1 hypothetical protein [Methylobacterium ajmalii]MBK3411755.1 hypothetical protein [Methylobacterium ajmalii]MBK3423300.1 hypothetical protein [Methylobacterium ajmalii]SFF53815.1 hypothetical protein SAMN04487844_12552 [Methylobacterium sp. yr596]